MARGRRDDYGLFESGIPPEVYLQRPGIQARRRLYEALSQQGLAPIPETQVKGRFSVPINPLQGASKVLNAYLGAKGIGSVENSLLKAYEDWKAKREENALAVGEGLSEATAPTGISQGGTPAAVQPYKQNLGPIDAEPPVPQPQPMPLPAAPPPVAGPVPPRPTGPAINPIEGIPPVTPRQDFTPPPQTPPVLDPAIGEYDRAQQGAHSQRLISEEMGISDAELMAPGVEQGRKMQPPDMSITRQRVVPGAPITNVQQPDLSPEKVMAIATQIAKERGIPVTEVMSHPMFQNMLKMSQFQWEQQNTPYNLPQNTKRMLGSEVIATGERPATAPGKWEIKEIYDESKPGGRQKVRVRTNEKTGEFEIKAVGDVGEVGPLATAEARADSGPKQTELSKKLEGGIADEYLENKKRAGYSHRNQQAVRQFLKASKTGTEGGAEPIFTAVRNFLSTFGLDSSKLTDAVTMRQGIADIKANYMHILGARGLTDPDMKILAESIMRVDTSREARETVAKLLNKYYDQDIEHWAQQREQLAVDYPDEKEFKRTPYWYPSYKKAKRLGKAPEGVPQEEWDTYSDEQKERFLGAGQ